MPGRCFDDMEPLTGDDTRRVVCWRGGSSLADLRGHQVAVRVRLHRATLYAVTFRGTEAVLNREDPRFPV